MAWGDRRRERKQAKYDARQERIRLRQEGRTSRQTEKQKTTAIMAEHGMQRGAIVGDLVSKGLDLAGKKMGLEDTEDKKSLAGLGGDDSQMGLILLAAIGGLFLFMKKKK